jgi:hypothetical protein
VAFKPKQPLDLVEVQVAPPQAGGWCHPPRAHCTPVRIVSEGMP